MPLLVFPSRKFLHKMMDIFHLKMLLTVSLNFFFLILTPVVNDKPFHGPSQIMWANTEINDFEYEEGGHSIVRNQWRSFNTIARCFIFLSSFISFDSYVLAFLFCVIRCCFWLWNVTCAWYVYRNDSWLRWTYTHACAHVCVCVCVRMKFVYENDQLNHIFFV